MSIGASMPWTTTYLVGYGVNVGAACGVMSERAGLGTEPGWNGVGVGKRFGSTETGIGVGIEAGAGAAQEMIKRKVKSQSTELRRVGRYVPNVMQGFYQTHGVEARR